jgi:hypothetical protein
MSMTELYSVVQALPRGEKLRLVQLLVAELARDEGICVLQEGAQYPVWTPYQAFDAAQALLEALKGESTQK